MTKRRHFDDDILIATEFKFIVDLGGRSEASRKLQMRGVKTATTGNIYNWVRRGSVPSDVVLAIISMKHECGQAIYPTDFELVDDQDTAA